MSKTKILSGVSIVLSLLLAYVFLSGGFEKVTNNPMTIASFENFGYSLWFMHFIGVAELLGGLGIVFGGILHPILQRLAASGLAIIMVGAIVSDTIHNSITEAIPVMVILAVLCLFIYIQTKMQRRQRKIA
jgi:putative oxidoreductase